MDSQTIFLLVGAASLALGFAVFQYYYRVKYQTSRNKVYTLLRFFSVFILLVLLINPTYESVAVYVEKPSLAVAIDNSSSIKYLGYDGKVISAIDRFRESESLNNAFDVDFYKYGQEFETLDSLDFKDKQTNISKALQELKNIYGNATAPVVLFSDGNQTYGDDIQYTSQNYKQQVYPVTLGDTITYDDLKIGQVNVNRYAYINNKFPIEIFVSSNGKNEIKTNLTIKSGSKIIFSNRLTFEENRKSQVVQTQIPATAVGVQQLTIAVTSLPNEKNIKNNFKNVAVEVIDQKSKVLLISNIVHPDIGMFKKSIESNRLRSVTLTDTKNALRAINEHELVILYQPDSRFKIIYEELLSLNKNTITVTGSSTDWRSLNRFDIGVTQEITNQLEEVQGILNPNFSSFVIRNLNFNEFPPLTTSFGDISFNTKIDVALYQRIGSLKTTNPLIATTDINGKRDVFILGEGLWKWRAQSFINKNTFEYFDNFIDNLVQFSSTSKKKSRLTLDYESFYYGNGEVKLYAQYFDKNYVFDARARLFIEVVNQDTNNKTTVPLLLNRNTYQIDLNNLSAGEYKFRVYVEDQNLSRSGSFTIIPFEIEEQFLNANVTSLGTLASNTTGQLYSIDQIDRLIDKLTTDNRYKLVQKSSKNIVPLIDLEWLMALLFLLLTLEWFMRKYNGLT